MEKFEIALLKINKVAKDNKIKWLLIGSYALYLQNFKFDDKKPKDIDIIVPSQKELKIFEIIFKEYIIKNRESIVNTGGEQVKFIIEGVQIEIFWEHKLTCSKFIDYPKWMTINDHKVPVISLEGELEARKKVVNIRGFYGDDKEKIEWMENLKKNFEKQ